MVTNFGTKLTTTDYNSAPVKDNCVLFAPYMQLLGYIVWQ